FPQNRRPNQKAQLRRASQNGVLRAQGVRRIADCGLRIADCGLRIDKTFNLDFEPAVGRTHKSAIRNPQSAIRSPTLQTLVLESRPRSEIFHTNFCSFTNRTIALPASFISQSSSLISEDRSNLTESLMFYASRYNFDPFSIHRHIHHRRLPDSASSRILG